MHFAKELKGVLQLRNAVPFVCLFVFSFLLLLNDFFLATSQSFKSPKKGEKAKRGVVGEGRRLLGRRARIVSSGRAVVALTTAQVLFWESRLRAWWPSRRRWVGWYKMGGWLVYSGEPEI